MGVALGAIAEDGDGLALELREVGVLVVEDVVGAHGGGGYRSALRISLPEGVRGSAEASSTRLGTLKPASDSAQWRRSSSGLAVEPLVRTTTAVTACCHSGSSRPITAASATSGWRSSTFPPSAGATFSPPLTIMSSIRSST